MSQKSLNILEIRNFIQSNVRLCLMAFSVVTLVLSGISMFSGTNSQTAFGANILSCPVGETLSGTNCVANAQENKTFATNCPTGYTEAYAICIKKRDVACTDAAFKGLLMDAETGACKFNTTIINATGGLIDNSRILDTQLNDIDGRYCGAPVFGSTILNTANVGTEIYNFKSFNAKSSNVDPATLSYVCSNNLQAGNDTSRLNFRIKKFVLDTTVVLNTANLTTVIGEYQTVQTGTNYVCPTGYTLVETSKCSRSAQPTNCTGGEYVLNGSCTICPANKYCPANANVGQNIVICPNGGTLSADKTKCVSPTGFKVSAVTQTEGCPAGYVKLDKSCAITETRGRNLDCSYFFSSNTSLAPAENDGVNTASGQNLIQCKFAVGSTFADGDIIKVSDLQCAGAGSGWYSYNVNYDPLVCGFTTYDTTSLATKLTFKWSNQTYQKFTPLQKLDNSTMVCPQGWTVLGTDNTLCYQAPITIVYRGPIDCPTGSTSNAGSMNSSDCGTTTVSTPVREIPYNPNPPVIKTKCISPIGYYTNSNGDCVMCPNGLTTVSTGSTSMDQCITPYVAPKPVVIVTERPALIRSGGSASIIAIVSALILSITGLSFFFINNKGSYTKSWSKIK